MDVGTAKSWIRDLLDIQTEEWLNNAKLCRALDQANKSIWKRVVATNPSLVWQADDITYPAGAEYVDLSDAGYLAENPWRIMEVERTDPSLAPLKLKPVSFHDRGAFSLTWSGTLSTTNYPYSYALQGPMLYVLPKPGASIGLRIYYVTDPVTIDTSSADADLLLGGTIESYTDHVATYAAFLLNAAQGGANKAVTGLWEQAQAEIQLTGGRRNHGEPRQVRRTRGW